jgi:hypothetical protein
MKEKLAWNSLEPNRLVDVWLHDGRQATSGLDKVYILEAYTIKPEVERSNRHYNRDYFGVLIKSFGLRRAKFLGNSYEFIYAKGVPGSAGTYNDIFSAVEMRMNVLVKKKIKKGYRNVTTDVSFHIPALHRDRKGLVSSSISESFLMNDIAQQSFKNRDVGKFVNIL